MKTLLLEFKDVAFYQEGTKYNFLREEDGYTEWCTFEEVLDACPTQADVDYLKGVVHFNSMIRTITNKKVA